MRVDFNVPQDKNDPTIITSTQRIDGALPSIKAVLEKGAAAADSGTSAAVSGSAPSVTAVNPTAAR